MSRAPLERFRAAIDKLERLKAESTPGPWRQVEWRGESLVEGDDRLTVCERISVDSDADLIVTLHRTIDAQLAILRFAADGLYDLPEFVALASAILGEAS